MSCCVPDFEMDEDYSFPTSSTSNKSPIAEEEMMELLWENGRIVMQSQNQRPVLNKRPPIGEDGAVTPANERRDIRSPHQVLSELTITDQLFMQEDEMAFWLHHYPMVDTTTDLCSNEIDPVASRTAPPIQDLRISPPPTTNQPGPKTRTEQGPSNSNKAVRESTMVDSCDTPCASPVAGSTVQVSGAVVGLSTADEGGGMETGAYEMTSSSGDSERVQKKPSPTAEKRKRKGREGDNSECAGEAVFNTRPRLRNFQRQAKKGKDVEFESPDAKKQNRGPTHAKKSRASEVHNLSERRRRDRINEKMRALQELIPHCNKSDKASMLDEAIEYLKSLQRQVQMMSMGCSMVPMMFPGVQQYVPPMGMAMGMGMSRPMLPFPSVLASSALPTPAAAAHVGPRFPVRAFHMPSVPLPGPSSQSDPVVNSVGPQNLNQPRMMNFPGPYPQYVGLHHTQLPIPQNQAMVQPSTSKPSISKEVENLENLQSG